MRRLLLVTSTASAQVDQPTLPSVPPGEGPPLEIQVDSDEYAVAGPAVGGTGLWLTVTERAGTEFDLCSGVAERLVDGVWVRVDTFRCEGAGRPAPQEEDVVLRRIHLAPYWLRGLVTDGGPGFFRMAFDARLGGQPLPAGLRTSPPFFLTDFSTEHPEATVMFERWGGWRALAVARSEGHTYVWGYSHRYGSAPAAVNRALEECRERSARDGGGACWVERLEPPSSPASDSD